MVEDLAWVDTAGRYDGWRGRVWEHFLETAPERSARVYHVAYHIGRLQKLRESGEPLSSAELAELGQLVAERQRLLEGAAS